MDGVLRTAMFREREHVVVPVIALMEGVVHAVNAQSPEFVPASELAKSANGWNGEPVMFNHPERDGQKVTANSPETLEQSQLGQVFNTRMDGTRLRMEAWVDSSRADVVGEQAQALLATLTSGGVVEVSVGAFITAVKASGSHKGKSYQAVWRDIVPDHLALLPAGTTGACSTASGCGAGTPRANSVYLVTAEGFQEEGETPMPDIPVVEPKTLRQRIREWFESLRAAEDIEGTSDMDLRQALHNALRSSEPAFEGIDAVFPEEKVVIYAVSPDGKLSLFKREYSLTDGAVALANERTEVTPVMRYEPVTAAADVPAAPPCGCHSQSNPGALSASAGVPKTMHKNAERITALIANGKTTWTEQDRTHMETMPDERIAALEAAANAEPPAPVAKELTLADLPEAWRKAIEDTAAAQAAARTESIEALAAAQTTFTRAELEALPAETLTKIATLATKPAATVTTFASRAPVVRAAEDAPPPPPDMNALIVARAAGRR